MGIKRKRLGPAPVDHREEWQKMADAGRESKAVVLLWSVGFSRTEARRFVAEYLERVR